MEQRARKSDVARCLLASVFAVVAAAGPAVAGDGVSASVASSDVDQGRETGPVFSGLMIHIDPQTGALLREPIPGAAPLSLSPDLTRALDSSHQGLVEEQGTAADAGVKIHLQGRFRNPLLATTDANGKVIIQHLREPVEADEAR